MANKVQTYANHVHFPAMTVVATVCLLLGVLGFALRWFLIGGRATMALGILGLIACNFVLIGISRVYTTTLQDRIIRLEMQVRCAGLMSAEQQRLLSDLPIKHVAALRFASDAELPALCERAARERLTPDEIKRAVKTWVPDHNRT